MDTIKGLLLSVMLASASTAHAGLEANIYAGWGLDAAGNISSEGLSLVGSFDVPNVDHWDGNYYSQWSPLGQVDGYTAIWTGQLNISDAGDYRFRLTSDDGSQLFLNNAAVISATDPQWFVPHEATVSLSAGAQAIKVAMYDQYLWDGIRLEWLTPTSSEWSIVPASAFMSVPEPSGAALSGLGLVALLGLMARRRAQA